jgi:hypothetical protein
MQLLELQNQLIKIKSRVYDLYMHTESEFQDITDDLSRLIDAPDDMLHS